MDARKVKIQRNIDLTAYDAVITWEELFSCYLLAEKILTKKKIAWIHPHYENCGFAKEYDFPFFKKLDGIVNVSKNCQNSMQKSFPEFKDRIFAVENSVFIDGVLQKSVEEQEEIFPWDGANIVTVARLQNISKALDRAVRVAARLKKANCLFKWYFVGDGEDREALKEMINQYGLQDEIILLGYQSNPYKYVKAADLFVLQSYYEGRPMVVDEAMIVGTPIFASEYGSAREQIPKKYGMVVENNEESIFNGLKNLLNEREKILFYKEALHNLNLDAYNATDRYMTLFKKVIE